MMQLKRTVIFPIILILGLVWIFLSADRSGASTGGLLPAPQEGFLAPDITLQTLTSDSITLSNLQGKAILVNFWATWCPPCRAEMPAIQEMYDTFQEQGLVILAVNATNQDTYTEIAPFLEEHGLTFPVLLDPSGEAGNLYQVRSLPTSIFIGKDGIVRKIIIGGPMSKALLQSQIEELLK
jgi:cytochrome c biogenesis protein CcmG/thiol:disulfide interchange protein DsbE